MLTLCSIGVSVKLLLLLWGNWIWAMTLSGMYSRVRVSLIGHGGHLELAPEASPEPDDEDCELQTIRLAYYSDAFELPSKSLT